MTAVIEPMRWWHVDAVGALERQAFPDDAWSPEQFWQELAQDTRAYLVAVDDAAVVGYGGVMIIGVDADVQTIAVSPTHRGAGLGARLLADLLSLARERDAVRVLLEVRDDNAPALQLYRRAGFARVTTRHRYYPDGGDAIVMQADLRDASSVVGALRAPEPATSDDAS